MKYGIREICDVVLKAKANQKIGNKIFYKDEPVLYFDTLKTSTLEGAATTVYAQGGRGNSRLVAWEGERTVTFTMEDALISPTGFAILSGAGLVEADKNNAIKVHTTEVAEVNRFGEDYYTEEEDITNYVIEHNFLCELENTMEVNISASIPKENLVSFDESMEKGWYLSSESFGEPSLVVGPKIDFDGDGEEDINPSALIREGLLPQGYWIRNEEDGTLNCLYQYTFPWGSSDYTPNFTFNKIIEDEIQDSSFFKEFKVAILRRKVQKIIDLRLNKQPYGKYIGNIQQGDELINYYDASNVYVMKFENGEAISEPYIPTRIANNIIELNVTRDDLDDVKVGDQFLVDYYTEVASGAQQIEITPDNFGGNYYLEATTLFRSQDGTDVPANFIIPNCKIQSNFNFTMASSGDPSTFTFTMDAFPDYLRFDKSKKVLAAIQLINDNKIDGSATRDRTKSNLKLK